MARLGRALVERQPLTGSEIGAALQERWPGVDARSLAFAVRAKVPLVQVPPRGLWRGVGRSRCTSAEKCLDRPQAQPDVAEMVRRYLAAYGPAGVRDAQAWSGLTGLGPVFADLRPGLRTFRDESGVELFDVPDAPRPSADTPSPVRLLPDFDSILISHQDRTRIFAAEHRQLIFTNNGIVHSSLLIDGFVRALWSITTEKETARLLRRPLPGVAIGESHEAAIDAEARELLAFAAPGKLGHVAFGSPLA